jgi:hypothetical protein
MTHASSLRRVVAAALGWMPTHRAVAPIPQSPIGNRQSIPPISQSPSPHASASATGSGGATGVGRLRGRLLARTGGRAASFGEGRRTRGPYDGWWRRLWDGCPHPDTPPQFPNRQLAIGNPFPQSANLQRPTLTRLRRVRVGLRGWVASGEAPRTYGRPCRLPSVKDDARVVPTTGGGGGSWMAAHT